MITLVGLLPFASTVLGGIAALRLRHRLHPVMALAAGIVVATALVDLLPEAIELIGPDGTLIAGAAAVVGYIVYTAIESLVHQQSYEHGHPPNEDPHEPHEHAPVASAAPSALGWLGPIGLILHSLTDGLAIGLGFEASPEVGVVVTLAVISHDFADGLNIVTLALSGGHGRTAPIVLLLADAAAPIVGIGASAVVPLAPAQLGVLLAGFAGAFLAIGAGHLLPEAEHRRPERATPLVALAAIGATLVVAVRMLVG